MVRVLSIAAALLVAQTAQPQTAGGKVAPQAEGGETFATILDAVSGAAEQTSMAVTMPTQLPVQPQAATVTPALMLETGDIAVETPNTALTFEQILAGASQPEAAAEAAPVNADAAPATPPQPIVGGVITTPAAAPAATQAAVATVQATTAAPVIAKSVNATVIADGETEGVDVAEGAEVAADRTVAPQSVPAGVVAATTTAPAMPAAGQTGDVVVADESAEPIDAAPAGVAPAPSGDEPAAEAPKAGAMTNTPSAAPTAADNAAAKTPVTPAVDMVAQTAAPAQAATSQAAVADALTAPTASGEAAKTQATPAALQSAPPATIQVYSRIIERADGRAQRFEIRLDPAELGRVDVRIEIGADRKVHAVLAAHDSAALTDLMRGQRALERALTDAGIDLADKGVRFELATDGGRDGANQRHDGQSNSSQRNNVWRGFDALTMPVDAETASVSQPARRSQRLDLVA